MQGIGLKRADQLQVETLMILKELHQFFWRLHLRQPILATLLRGFDRDALPLRLLCRGVLIIQTNNGTIGKNRGDFCCANLNRFLHDQIHVFPFGNRLAKCDVTAER